MVAMSSLMFGLAFSSMEAERVVSWAHEMLLVAIVPTVL
jgi:hypothetical protein